MSHCRFLPSASHGKAAEKENGQTANVETLYAGCPYGDATLRAIDVAARSDAVDRDGFRLSVHAEQNPPVADPAPVSVGHPSQRADVAGEWIGGHLLDGLGDALLGATVCAPKGTQSFTEDADLIWVGGLLVFRHGCLSSRGPAYMLHVHWYAGEGRVMPSNPAL